MSFNKFAGVFSILLGGLGVLGIFLPIGVISAFGVFSIEITSLGKISGFPLFSNLSDLESFAGSLVAIPLIIGYVMLILAIAISILGIIQLISSESRSVVIFIIVIGLVLIVITIIQFFIFRRIKKEVPTFAVFLDLFIAFILNLATAKAGVGFYVVLTPTIIVVATSLIHLVSIKRESY